MQNKIMDLIGEILLKIIKVIWYIILRILMMSWLLLLVGNIMWLFYSTIGKGLSSGFDFFMEKKTDYINLSWALSTGIIQWLDSEKLFMDSCDMWDDEGQWRFLMHFDKICLLKWTKADKIDNMDRQTIYHELTHYKLRNLPIDKKLLMRDQIVTQISDIKEALSTLKKDNLTWDDIHYFGILSWSINKYASDPVYNFYDYTKDMIISYRGNEEYITYAMQFLVQIDENKDPYFTEYKLNNPQLEKIRQWYKQIYQDLWIIK